MEARFTNPSGVDLLMLLEIDAPTLNTTTKRVPGAGIFIGHRDGCHVFHQRRRNASHSAKLGACGVVICGFLWRPARHCRLRIRGGPRRRQWPVAEHFQCRHPLRIGRWPEFLFGPLVRFSGTFSTPYLRPMSNSNRAIFRLRPHGGCLAR